MIRLKANPAFLKLEIGGWGLEVRTFWFQLPTSNLQKHR